MNSSPAGRGRDSNLIDARAVFGERTRYVAELRERELRAIQAQKLERATGDEKEREERNVIGALLVFFVAVVACIGGRALWVAMNGGGR